MHEATIWGSDRIGHNTSGGIEIAISSRIEIMISGYRESRVSVDALDLPVFPDATGHDTDGCTRRALVDFVGVGRHLSREPAGTPPRVRSR